MVNSKTLQVMDEICRAAMLYGKEALLPQKLQAPLREKIKVCLGQLDEDAGMVPMVFTVTILLGGLESELKRGKMTGKPTYTLPKIADFARQYGIEHINRRIDMYRIYLALEGLAAAGLLDYARPTLGNIMDLNSELSVTMDPANRATAVEFLDREGIKGELFIQNIEQLSAAGADRQA